jgi:RND family efflux transporter MFP subunit
MMKIMCGMVAVCLCLAAERLVAAESIATSGITEPYLDVTLAAPVPGLVKRRAFKEGDLVKKGDVIVELDKGLEELEVERRLSVMERNKTELDATRVLVTTTKSVSKDELGKKEMDYRVSKAEHGIAVEELARRKVIAPFSGSIVELTLQVGAASAPYQPLARLVDTSRCYFVGYVEGKNVSRLRMDEPVMVDVEGATGPVEARICFISPVIDPASGLAKVKALFENPKGNIRPGLAAKMTAH